MFVSGQSKENGQGGRSARLREQIEKQRREITVLTPAQTTSQYLSEAKKREELADLLWQDQKLKEAAIELQKVVALENKGAAPKEKMVATLDRIATVCRDSNNYSDMILALHKIQTLDEKDPSTPREVVIKDKQNIATANFLCALAETNPVKRSEQLAVAQVMMEELKKELLNDRPIASLSPAEKILLATNDENQSAIFIELGDIAAARPLKDEAQTLRSALR